MHFKPSNNQEDRNQNKADGHDQWQTLLVSSSCPDWISILTRHFPKRSFVWVKFFTKIVKYTCKTYFEAWIYAYEMYIDWRDKWTWCMTIYCCHHFNCHVRSIFSHPKPIASFLCTPKLCFWKRPKNDFKWVSREFLRLLDHQRREKLVYQMLWTWVMTVTEVENWH